MYRKNQMLLGERKSRGCGRLAGEVYDLPEEKSNVLRLGEQDYAAE